MALEEAARRALAAEAGTMPFRGRLAETVAGLLSRSARPRAYGRAAMARKIG